jgi:hypothetical protein
MVAALLPWGAPVQAENLNQKYGPSWNCSYITAGDPLYEACRPREARNMDFYRDSPSTGHCVPRGGAQAPGDSGVPHGLTERHTGPSGGGSPPPQAYTPAPAPRAHRWGAVAAGIREGDPSHVGVGAAWNEPNRERAEELAIEKCQEQGVNCSVVGTFDTGCGYITVGHNDRGGVGWGSGPTAQRAYDNCQNQGLECKTQTIGGCIQD